MVTPPLWIVKKSNQVFRCYLETGIMHKDDGFFGGNREKICYLCVVNFLTSTGINMLEFVEFR